MNRTNIQKILFLLKKKYKKKKRTTLLYSSAFECLISVILSAQSQDIIVNKSTKNLFLVANNPKKMILLGEKKIRYYIKNIGLYKKKAKNIFQTCILLLNTYKGLVPSSRKELEKLPGVGRKTSNVVLNLIFNKKTIAVDTHVFRICNRLGLAIGNTPIKVESILLKIIPNNMKLYIHSWLLFHGRNVCQAKNIQCNICILYKLCKYNNKLKF
ncbi:Endonuclease III [Buchnera aphidicola (Periphyllus testudinaceus)]|uniref:endonuclease III n=1 Tax=Buchnera aphidicola TaxID=9 RepID=UPI0034647BE1